MMHDWLALTRRSGGLHVQDDFGMAPQKKGAAAADTTDPADLRGQGLTLALERDGRSTRVPTQTRELLRGIRVSAFGFCSLIQQVAVEAS